MLSLLIFMPLVNILARENSIAMIRQGNQLLCMSSDKVDVMWQYSKMVAGKYQIENATTAFIHPDSTFQNISCQDAKNKTKVLVNSNPSQLHLNVTCSPGWYGYCVPNDCSSPEKCREDDDFCLCIKNDTPQIADMGPTTIQYFDFYALNETSIYFRWDPPFFANTGLYRISYKLLYLPQDSFTFKPKPCTIWPWMHCTSVHHLYPGQFYTFEISARYNGSSTWLNSTSALSLIMQTSNPDPPVFLTSFWDKYYNLTLKWQYPNRTNGILESFQINLNKTKYTVPVGTPHLYYSYLIAYTGLLNIDVIQVSIICKNMDLKVSLPLTTNIDFPPPTPTLSQQPVLIKIFDKSVRIGIPALNKANEKSYVHVIITKIASEGDPHINPEETQFISQLIHLEPNMMAWIATEYRFHENTSVNLTIGDMTKMFSDVTKQQITNWDLPQGVNLKIFIVVLNKRKELLRFTRYDLETALPKPTSPFVYASFLVLVIPIASYCTYIVRKKKIRFVRL